MPAKSAHHIRGPDEIKELNIAGGEVFRENIRKNIRGFVIDDFIFTSGKIEIIKRREIEIVKKKFPYNYLLINLHVRNTY